MAETDAATIDEALDAFLAEHRERLSPTTARGYADVVALLRSSLKGYAYSSLDDDELAAWQQAFDGGEEHAFCRLFGPEKIPEHLGHFLGYFMVRKVMASRQLPRHQERLAPSSCAGWQRTATSTTTSVPPT